MPTSVTRSIHRLILSFSSSVMMLIPQKHQTLASHFLIQLQRRSFSVLLAFSFSVFPPTIRVSVNGLDVVVRLFASFLVPELFLVTVISQYYSPNGSVHRRCSC